MSVSVAAMISPAEADFLYVPPREAAAAAESGTDRTPTAEEVAAGRNDLARDPAPGDPEAAATRADRTDAHRRAAPLRVATPLRVAAPLRVEAPLRVAAPRYADAEPLEKSDSPGVWQVRAGEMLREALGRWGEDAGVEVLFLTDRRYRLHEGRRFHGSIGEASQALFAALSHLPHPPVGEVKATGGTLVVLHQASPHGTGDGQ